MRNAPTAMSGNMRPSSAPPGWAGRNQMFSAGIGPWRISRMMIVDSGIERTAGEAAAINGISIQIMAFSFQTKRMEKCASCLGRATALLISAALPRRIDERADDPTDRLHFARRPAGLGEDRPNGVLRRLGA